MYLCPCPKLLGETTMKMNVLQATKVLERAFTYVLYVLGTVGPIMSKLIPAPYPVSKQAVPSNISS